MTLLLKYQNLIIIVFLLLLGSILEMACNNGSDKDKFQVFEMISSKHSGITFANDITANVATKENLLDFDYFYNGAGVGVGDINNDGLPDIFFCANQNDNKLYLNNGDLQFDDITDRAGINIGKNWSNGVTFVDINRDGWLDIYVSQGGPHEEERRSNLLYINNKDLTFTESANIYGLDDQGISTQSVFFDYDKDGDMDCFVMNESVLYGYDPVSFHRMLLENAEEVYVSYSHLYRNDNGYFKDVTSSSGITSPTFGLGLTIADINEDGWLDIYIANDYYQPDNMYMNRKDGSFYDRAKSHLSQMSFFGMGVDIADINNNGHQDIFVLDMASKDHVRSKTLMASMNLSSFDLLVNQFKFPYQYMFNSLQVNNGKGIYHNVAQMAGVAKTDWSWAGLIEDFDQDGRKDIFVTNGYRKYGTDNDFQQRVKLAKDKYFGAVPNHVKDSLYQSMPSEALSNYMFQQIGELEFVEVQKKWGLSKPTFSNGTAISDLDGDGDLEIIINNIDQEAQIYKNNTTEKGSNNFINISLPREADQYAKIVIKYGENVQSREIKRVRGYMSSVEPIAHFGLGNHEIIDEMKITFQDGTEVLKRNLKANQILDITNETRQKLESKIEVNSKKFRVVSPLALGIDYKHRENYFNDFENEILLPFKQSTLGPCLAITDLNGDSIDDFFIGGASGQSGAIYISTGKAYSLLQSEALETDKMYEDVSALFIDIDSDGDEDLIVLSGGNEWESNSEYYKDRIYIQSENGAFQLEKSSFLSNSGYVGGCIKKLDFDRDGDMDVIVGNRIIPQSYPLPAPSFLFENVNGTLVDITEKTIPDLSRIGIINDIEICDVNNDGWADVICVGEWEKPAFLINKNGIFYKEPVEGLMEGLWFSVTTLDIDNDGDDDFVLGNIGENYKIKPTTEDPLLIYAGDLDNNGTHDLVLSAKYKGEYVPVRGKECSSEQLPFITDKFESYKSFASSSLIDVYGEENLRETYQRQIKTTSSVVLINQGDFNFKYHLLPKMAQSFPMLDAVSIDLNNDQTKDLIAGGTIFDTEVETPRLDAGSGIVLISEGATLVECPDEDLYLHISGDIRRFGILNRGNENKSLLVARNNSGVSILDIIR